MIALLLVGGMGTRLQSVLPATAKPLAPVGEKPFLELLILQLRAQGILRLVMCTGHLAQQLEEQVGDGKKWDVAIEYSKEPRLLGTAGAIKFAKRHLDGVTDFLVMNGDSFLEVDFGRLVRLHTKYGGVATVATRKVADAARYGTVRVDGSNRILAFEEKRGFAIPGSINGGVYVFNKRVLAKIPEGPVSLEKEILPQLISAGIYAVEHNGMFIDIGTPEDYGRAQFLFDSLRQAAEATPVKGAIVP